MQLSGTSFAAPVVAGAAANILAQHPTLHARPGQGRADAHRERARQERRHGGGVGVIQAKPGGGPEQPAEPEPGARAVREVDRHERQRGHVSFDSASWNSAATGERLLEQRFLELGLLEQRLLERRLAGTPPPGTAPPGTPPRGTAPRGTRRSQEDAAEGDAAADRPRSTLGPRRPRGAPRGDPATCRTARAGDGTAEAGRSAAAATQLRPAPTSLRREQPGTRARRSSGPLGSPARLYFWLVVAAAVAATMPFLDARSTRHARLGDVRGPRRGAAVAQLFVVVTPANQSYHTTGVFLLPAALLLPPELVALIAFVQHVPDWLKRRLPFHIQAFNIANYTLATMAAWGVAHAILGSATSTGDGAPAARRRASAACVVFVGAEPRPARADAPARARRCRSASRASSRSSNLSTDLVLAGARRRARGALALRRRGSSRSRSRRSCSCTARSRCPRSRPRRASTRRPGLFNARHFAATLRDELEPGRALRPADVADHGRPRPAARHQQHLRPPRRRRRPGRDREDLPRASSASTTSRRGSAARSSRSCSRRRRRRRRSRSPSGSGAPSRRPSFEVETSSEPIRATVSFGVAGFPRDGVDANELVHQADLAVYRAKLQGRNRVLDASDEPLLARPDRARRALAALPDGDRRAGARRCRLVPERQPGVRARATSRSRMRLAGPALRLGAAPPRRPRRPSSAWSGSARASPASSSARAPTCSGSIAIVALVGIGQALSLELEQTGTISVSAVGALAGAAIIGPRAALALAITMCRGRVERPPERLPPAALQRRRAHARVARRGGACSRSTRAARIRRPS